MKAGKIKGVLKKFTNQKVWNGAVGMQQLNDAQLLAIGIKDVILDTLTTYQKYGALYEDSNGDFKKYVLDFSTDEIEAHEEKLVDDKLDTYQNDGVEFLRVFRNFVYRKYKGGEITENQFKGIRSILAPALMPLKVGAWDLAKDLVDAISEPSNAKMKTLLNKVKNKIDTYITDNY